MSKLKIVDVCTRPQITYVPNPFNDRRTKVKLNLVWVQTAKKTFKHKNVFPDGKAFTNLIKNLQAEGAKIDTKHWIEVTQ